MKVNKEEITSVKYTLQGDLNQGTPEKSGFYFVWGKSGWDGCVKFVDAEQGFYYSISKFDNPPVVKNGRKLSIDWMSGWRWFKLEDTIDVPE